MTSQKQWADDEEEVAIELPENEYYEDEESGIKTVIEYTLDSKKKIQKTTTKYAMKTRTKKVSQSVAERANWKKFGKTANQSSDHTTIVSKEEFKIEDPKDGGEAEKKAQAEALRKLAIKFAESNTKRRADAMLRGGLHNEELEQSMNAPAAASSNRYIPPGAREGGGGMREENPNTLRVTNLSEDTKESDLVELFKNFGRTTRVFLSRNKETLVSRGFAYVSFEDRGDATRALQALNGFGYDHLILKVEWAAPSEKRDIHNEGPRFVSGYGKPLPQG